MTRSAAVLARPGRSRRDPKMSKISRKRCLLKQSGSILVSAGGQAGGRPPAAGRRARRSFFSPILFFPGEKKSSYVDQKHSVSH